MFFPGSRYEKLQSYSVTRPDGTTVAATRLPLALVRPVRGLHRRVEGQRLDLIAAHYLQDATTFWRLCDASGAVAPDALAARALCAIPVKNGGG
jgi:hypothetical protein